MKKLHWLTVISFKALLCNAALLVSTLLLSSCSRQTAIGSNFVYVKGGTFQMGSLTGDFDEAPVHSVTVGSFIISKYEVTQKEWFEVMGTTLAEQRDMRNSSLPLYGEGDNHPMYYISWYEAVDYCNRRSLQEGLTPVYLGSVDNIICNWDANGYRLPTEAEWEYAAKGGTGRTFEYSGSNKADAVAWYDENSKLETKPVGTKAANRLGLYDMSGNVWEWCWDWFGYYDNHEQIDPRGPSSGIGRVTRGGGWLSMFKIIRTSYRAFFSPSDRSYTIGFRVVRKND